MSKQSDLRALCQPFIASAFAVLTEQHVLPTAIFHQHIAVGRDYEGASIMYLREFRVLESRLNEDYPERFANPLTRRHAEFAQTYIFSFLEACIARCARAGNFTSDSAAVDESINELLTVLEPHSYEVVCARRISHLTTASGQEIQIGDVTIVPEPEGHRSLFHRIRREIPAAPRAWNPEPPRTYDPPHALLIIRQTTDDPDPYAVSRRLSARLERFLLIARLLTAGTVTSAYEICGMTTLTAPMNPVIRTSGKGFIDTLIRRTVRLTGEEAPAFAALGDVIDAADVTRDGIVTTSFDVALAKFNDSHTGSNPFGHLVDLATALEGVLIGAENEGEGLTLRLRSRAAALLAGTDDPGTVVFDDVGQLYTLRSKLVHGGPLTEKTLRKVLRGISSVPDEDAERRFGIAVSYAVDRMRDLVRRAILARLCLGELPEPRWPFTGHTSVDAILTNDAQRQAWRVHWHNRLAELGAGPAAGRPRAAVDVISQDDR